MLNPSNGSVVRAIGGMGHVITGLAIDPTSGHMYGVTGYEDSNYCLLVKVNKTTGATTPVGPEVNGCPIADITFGANGVLYGWSGYLSNQQLYRINKATGLATPVGTPQDPCPSTFSNHYGTGLAMAPSGKLFLASCTISGAMDTVDPVTGVATFRAQLNNGPTMCREDLPVSALAFNSAGELYASIINWCASPYGSFLAKIDKFDGHIVTLGPSVHFLDAIVFGH